MGRNSRLWASEPSVKYDSEHDILYVWLAASSTPAASDEILPGIRIDRAIGLPREPKVGFVVMDARRRSDMPYVRSRLLRQGFPRELVIQSLRGW